MKWYKIASQRVNSTWWDSVLAPLRGLESGATGGVVHSRTNQIVATEANMNDSFVPTRSSLEDIELETRALTEPLPTNQQVFSKVTLANMLFDIVDTVMYVMTLFPFEGLQKSSTLCHRKMADKVSSTSSKGSSSGVLFRSPGLPEDLCADS